jgi:hypothetical protein
MDSTSVSRCSLSQCVLQRRDFCPRQPLDLLSSLINDESGSYFDLQRLAELFVGLVAVEFVKRDLHAAPVTNSVFNFRMHMLLVPTIGSQADFFSALLRPAKSMGVHTVGQLGSTHCRREAREVTIEDAHLASHLLLHLEKLRIDELAWSAPLRVEVDQDDWSVGAVYFVIIVFVIDLFYVQQVLRLRCRK